MWTDELQGMIDNLAKEWQNNFFPRILIISGMTFKFEYLGEFEFIFENNLGAWSWAQELAFDEKKMKVENLVQVYLYAEQFTYPWAGALRPQGNLVLLFLQHNTRCLHSGWSCEPRAVEPWIGTIDGQVRLVRLQMDNFCLFLRKQMDRLTNFRLHNEQTVNGLRKIASTSVFHFPFETPAYTVYIICRYRYI
jgi:hypothetical protein